MLGPDGVGHELLGSTQKLLGRLAVVESGRRQDVGPKWLLTQHVFGPRVGTFSLAVPWRGEAVAASPVIVGQAVENGGVVLVHASVLPVRAPE